MPKHENLEAYIMCDGERLEEYDVQTDGNVVTCWVESKLDKCFEVFVDNPYEDRVVESHLYLDGMWATGRYAKEKQRGVHKEVHVDDENACRFKFCALQLTDDDKYFNNGTCTEKLGTIELKICFVIDTGKRQPRQPYKRPDIKFAGEPVHESTKKLALHRVGVSEETIKQPPSKTAWVVAPFDKNNPGVALSFCFKYRPRAFLEAQGLVEPATKPPADEPELPQPQVSEKKRRIEMKKEDLEYEVDEIDGETDEKIRELEAELEQLKQTRKKRRMEVKKEPKEDPDAAPAMKLVILDDGVIDLT